MVATLPPSISDIQGMYSLESVGALDPTARLRESNLFLAWAEIWGFDVGTFSWEDQGHMVPLQVIQEVFTFSEQMYLYVSGILASPLGDHIEKSHFLLWKIHNSHWRYGMTESYDLTLRHLRGLQSLCVDLPGFDLRLTWSTFFNPTGTSAHIRGVEKHENLYLDGPFGLLVYYKGQHVMTIGFALSSYGVLVSQVQLRAKTGNRFLFKLPEDYLEWALRIVARAFPEDQLWLPTGASVTQAVRKSYGSTPCSLTPEIEERIQKFYNRPLRGYARTRSPKPVTYYGRNFRALKPKRQETLGTLTDR
mgnify:CR=1 FL=1